MKKILTLIVATTALLFAGNTQAQHLGIHFGYAPENIPTYSPLLFGTGQENLPDAMQPHNAKISKGDMQGLFGGLSFTYDFSDNFGVTAAVNGRYNTRNYEYTENMLTNTVDENQLVVDVPVLLSFGIPLSGYSRLALYAGPQVSYAINGSSKVTNSILGQLPTIDWYADPARFKKLNVQATFGLALSVHHIRFFGGYTMGVLNIDTRNNYKTTTSAVYLGLGYYL